jgi:hypothetical protein
MGPKYLFILLGKCFFCHTMAAAVFLVNYFLIELINGISHKKLNFYFSSIFRVLVKLVFFFKRETAKVLLNIK